MYEGRLHFLFWIGCGGLIGAALCAGETANAGTVDRPFFRANAVVVVIGASDSSENGGTAPVAVDFNLLDNVTSGNAANDIIAQDGYTTNFNGGQFNASSDGSASGYEFAIQNQTFGGAFISAGPHQTLDENDAYTAFGLDDTTDMDLVTGNRASRFLVASNTAFDIYAEASDLVATGDFSTLDYSNIRYRLRLNVTGGSGAWQWGARAQSPQNGGGGIVNTVNDLDDMSAGPTKVFDGGRRTANAPGTLIQHAVGFQSRYRLRGAGGVINNYDLSMGTGELGATVTYTIYTP
jgi:hypothetical protein